MEAYEKDELNFHGGLRVSFGMQMLNMTSQIERELPYITWPFYILHGDADKLCDIRGSQLMYNEAKSTDKKLKVSQAFRNIGQKNANILLNLMSIQIL